MSKIILDEKLIDEILTRGVEDVIEKEHLKNSLLSGKQLRVKFGIDPTSSDLHIGHMVVLRKLREFQDLGHKIILIIGDFTAMIGDPSGKSKTRPSLSEKEVKKNMNDYLRQASNMIDIKKTEVRYNSEWLEKLNGVKILELLSLVSVNQILERNDFAKRLKEQQSIRAHELLYPIMQAYDSVVINADLECGGTDQTFNMFMGRTLMDRMGRTPQDILTVPILEGVDGKEKMSKSLGNYIGVTDMPSDMFEKVMSVPDNLIIKYFMLTVDLSQDKIEMISERLKSGENPRDIKLDLAESITTLYHNAKKAKEARGEFINVFSNKEKPSDIEEYKISKNNISLVDILAEASIASSKSDAKRLVEQGGVKMNDEVHKDIKEVIVFKGGEIIQVGKRRFLKIKI
ncbi:MAG: tyrosine--tRNA ligase [Patescibacteria group bacterium]